MSWRESPAVGELFQRAGMKGTFVLYDVAARTYRGHDETRANQRFVPASTFKIPNSLIGLTVGAVAGPDEVLPYRGDPPLHPGVGAGHEPARGHPVVQRAHLSGTGPAGWPGAHGGAGGPPGLRQSGHRHPGGPLFWLDGPLQISAMEQVRFLARLAGGSLPFPRRPRRRCRTSPAEGANWTWKTGWWNARGPGLGWWVGWVDRQGRIFAFALNLDMRRAEDAGKRLELGKGESQGPGRAF